MEYIQLEYIAEMIYYIPHPHKKQKLSNCLIENTGKLKGLLK